MVPPKKPWYMTSTKEVLAFFDVDPSVGLDDQNVLKRLRRFGSNTIKGEHSPVIDYCKVTVRRNGNIHKVSPDQIVPGDIVLIREGDRVPADLRLLHVEDLRIDESTITGEAMPSAKNTYSLGQPQTDLSKQKCMAFAGTFVDGGSGWGVVVAHKNKVAVLQQARLSKHKKRFGLEKIKAKNVHRKTGILLKNKQASRKLKEVDLIFVNTDLGDDEIMDLIRRVQLGHNWPCKFIISSSAAQRLSKELPGSLVYYGNQLDTHVPKQLFNMITEVQFIAEPTVVGMSRLVGVLQQHGKNVMWVTNGKSFVPITQIAHVSLVVGGGARHDILEKADMVYPRSDMNVLLKLLKSKK